MSVSRSISIFCFLFSLLFLFSACGNTASATSSQAINAICASQTGLPPGRIYVRSAAPDDAEFLSDALLAATYGNGYLPPEMDEVTDAACFFSYTQPCEIAVFLCKTAAGTDAVAEMCLRRLDTLKQYRSKADIDESTHELYLENATVTVRGRWDILCAAPDPDAALRAFRKIL